MVKTNKKIFVSIALIIITIFTLANSIYAFNPDDYDPTPSITDSTIFLQKAGEVIGFIQYIGIIISIVVLVIIGLKYLFSSVEGKAEYKKTMMPYIIGCVMVGGICLILEVIEEVVK